MLRRDTVQDEASVKRFFTEARAIASLRSPHTITLHDFGITDDGLVYYTMEMLEGAPLSALIKRHGSLSYRRAVEVIFQSLESLEEAHQANILHRDLKPENLFVATRKGKDFVTLLDFGIAKLVGDTSIETVTKTGMICGTPAYLSPEQVMGNPAVPASDLYSLAIVLYEMLAGEPPFSDTTAMKLLLKHLNEEPVPVHVKNPGVKVPRSIDRFLARAMAKRPEDRFATVAEFRRALKLALSDHAVAPETSELSPLVTTSDGLRAMVPGTAAYEAEYAHLQDQQTEPQHAPRDAVDDGSDTAVVPLDLAVLAIDGGPGSGGGKRLWKRVAGGLVLAGLGVGLVLWQPWGSQGVSDGIDTVQPASAPAQEAVTPSIQTAPVVPVDEPEKARLKAELEELKAEQAEHLAAEAEAKKAAESDRVALEAARVAAAEEAAARLAAAEAEAKKVAAAEAEARKVAAAEAEAKKVAAAEAEAEAEAEARKRARERAEKKKQEETLGFRPIKVKEVPKDDGGLGFRPVKVEEK